MTINQKHGIPRLTGGDNFPLSRGKFLDGTIKTYFGPGQLPNCAPGFRVRMADALEVDGQTPGDEGKEIDGVYVPPSDWPKAGSLLRVPQVAWLSFCFPFWSSSVGVARFEPTAFSCGGLMMDGFGNVIGSCGSKATGEAYGPISMAHPEVAETERIKSVFAGAKARIESLRPNKTFVEVFDWLDTDFAGNHGYMIADNWPHFSAPPWTFLGGSGVFFGVNFLHIFAGSTIEDRKIEENNYVRIIKQSYAGSPPVSLSQSVDRVIAAASTMAGFQVKLYSVDLPVPDIPDYDFTPSLEYTSLGLTDWHVPDDGGASPDGDQPPAPFCAIPVGETEESVAAELDSAVLAAAANRTEEIQGAIASARSSLTGHFDRTLANMEYSLSALGSRWSFTHSGPAPASIEGTTSDLTEDSLVALIAGHFGFDPETGDDLG